MAQEEEEEEKADALREQGNAHFKSKQWTLALESYQASVEHQPNSRAYSNLAATLCKLDRYSEALVAAERATVIDPKWAKGWWRRGVVAELNHGTVLPQQALKYYNIAVELEPDNEAFREHKEKLEKKLNVTRYDEAGFPVLDLPNKTNQLQEVPALVAWSRFCHENPTRSVGLYVQRQRNDWRRHPENVSSEQWLLFGIVDWAKGLREATACLTLCMHAESRQRYQQLAIMPSSNGKDAMIHKLLGAIPGGYSLQTLTSAISSLGGMHIFLQTGVVSNVTWATKDYLCPQPAGLSKCLGYQSFAICYSIFNVLNIIVNMFGPDVPVAPAVLHAAETFRANVGGGPPGGQPAKRPVEAVQYMKDELRQGQRTWDHGLRQYAVLQYRGTILFAVLLRLSTGQVAASYEHEKWAREFITLADQEFKVSQEGAYGEKGVTFMPSFRIGMMQSELQSLMMLCGDGRNNSNKKSLVEAALKLCLEIIDMANHAVQVPRSPECPDYSVAAGEVAYRRKPLALAHSTIGHQLCSLQNVLPSEQWMAMVRRYSLDTSKKQDPQCTIAEHYRRAAQAELPDCNACAIYWYCCGSSMCQAGPVYGDDNGELSAEPYTVGELRAILDNALKSEAMIDVDLFGKRNNGAIAIVGEVTDEAIVVLTLEHFREKPDSFRLPRIHLVVTGAKKNAPLVLVSGDDVIADDIRTYRRQDHSQSSLLQVKFDNNSDDHIARAMVDCKIGNEIEDKYGADLQEEIPLLETLCIRQLHRQGCEYAIGESDGAVIQYNYLRAAATPT